MSFVVVDPTKMVHSEESGVTEGEAMATRVRGGGIRDFWGRHEGLGRMVIIRPWVFPLSRVENCYRDLSRGMT